MASKRTPTRRTKRFRGRKAGSPPQGKLLSVPVAKLARRSQEARNRAFHVLAAMRQDARLTLSRASRLQGVKPGTVTKYFPSAFTRARGKLRVKKSDRFKVTLYLPDEHGKPVEFHTGSYKERQEAGEFLRDLGRASRGDVTALSRWRGKKIAGVELVTDIKAIRAMEPALSDFALYRTFNAGNA